MNPWKLLCAGEALVLVALLAWNSADPISGTAGSAEVEGSVPSLPVARVLKSDDPPGSILRSEIGAAAPGAKAMTRPWSAAPGLVTILGAVVDESGAPITNPSIWIVAGGEVVERIPTSQSTFLISDHSPGTIELRVTASGFEPWQQPLLLQDSPRIQECVIRLARSWRIVLWLRTSDGRLLLDALRDSPGSRAAGMRVRAVALKEAAVTNRRAKDFADARSDLGVFVRASVLESSLPQGASGALDVRGPAPFVISVWLDRLLLGSVPIRAGMTEATLVVDPSLVLDGMARVRLRTVDASTGQPLAGVLVILSPHWGGGVISALTNGDGRIEWTGVRPENLDLETDLAGYADVFRQLQVDPHSNLDLGDLRLSPQGIIPMRVESPDGSPCAEATFRWFPTEGWTRPEEPRRSLSRTDAEGRVSARAGACAYQAIFGGRDGIGLQAEVWPRGSVETEERVIRLREGSEVRLAADHGAGEARLVWLMDLEGRLLSGSWHTGRQPETWILSPGAYLLRVEDLDRNHLTTLELRVPAGGGDLRVELP